MSDTPSDDRDAFLHRFEAQTQAALAQTDFWRRLAKWALGVLALAAAGLVALAIVLVMIANSTHEQGAATRDKANQVLSIARVFLCEQSPTPKGCPPHPPPSVSPTTQVIIDDIIAQLERIYPPPNGLR